MKVLQINSVCGIRSTGRICTDIADILKTCGDDCKVGYGREKVPAERDQYAVRIGNDRGVKCHALMSRIFDNTGYGSKKATEKFLERVTQYDPDIIHLHNLHGYYINIELLFNYLKKVNKPVVWTLHDCWPFTGHCTYFDYINCKKWEEKGCNSCPLRKVYPSSMLFDHSKKNYIEKKQLFTGIPNMTIVTPSQWLADLVKRSFLKEYPVQVIHNGINLSAFKPAEGNFRERYGLQNKTVLLGVASVWDARKGFSDFIKMSELKLDNEAIVLVGLTSDQISNLPDGIIGISRTNSTDELAEIYTTADVFVNPTYEDNYPTVNLEAQACGTPVVTYQTGGSVENVPSDYVVPKGDVEALFFKAREAASSPEIIDISAFSRENCYAKYIELYHKIIDYKVEDWR